MRKTSGWMIFLAVCFLGCGNADRMYAGERPRRIAVFGSSVAYGTGDQITEEIDRVRIEPAGAVGPDGLQRVRFQLMNWQAEGEMMLQTKDKSFANILRSDGISFSIHRGYQGRLRESLVGRGWEVLNCSRGGDRTERLMRRYEPELLPVKPGYVFIGLSLANEGLRRLSGDTMEKKQEVCDTFTTGMKAIIERIRKDGMDVAMGLNYPHDVYTREDYELLKQKNLEMNGWDVPSANFLGAVDDGRGHWVTGYNADGGHPNAAGHLEMFYAIVPPLFEALEAGKGTPKRILEQDNGWKTDADEGNYLCFDSEFAIHSHAVYFRFRSSGDGILTAANSEDKGWRVEQKDGTVYYRGINGKLSGEGAMTGDAAWHTIAISHRWAAEQTEFYVDGQMVGHTSEQFAPQRFILGADEKGQGGAAAEFGEWMIYRSSLNPEEVKRLHEGGLIQASMEVYCHFPDNAGKESPQAVNQAQSLSQVKIIPR